jgi:hypothetical protein
MKLPSLDSLVKSAAKTFVRFAPALVLAVAATWYCMRWEHGNYSYGDVHNRYWNIVQSCYLGMLLSIALTVFAESRRWGKWGNWGLQAGGLLLVLGYYFSLPATVETMSIIRFALFLLGLHLLIAFVPFTRGAGVNGFWQYNKILFLRILASALYTGVLFAGLALALLAVEKLFKVDISGNRYADLWFLLTGVFNTWYFLAGVPADYASLEGQRDYPKGLKIFTQYVLLPILTVYLVILYAYMIRIVITAQWPVGWVSYLILGFSVAGILSLLLIHPIREEAGNKWILAFSRFYYFALVPLIVLLGLAIARRVGEYGITERRYFICLLASWLLFITVYFITSNVKNIRVIPQSLCLIAFLSSFGPWGAFSVSLHAQRARLLKVLERNQMLVGGKITVAAHPVSFADNKAVSGITEYLVGVHGYGSLQPFFRQNLDSLSAGERYDYGLGRTEKVLRLMQLEYINEYQTEKSTDRGFTFNVEAPGALDITGYNYVIPDYTYSSYEAETDSTGIFHAGALPLKIHVDTGAHLFSIGNGSGVVCRWRLDSLVKALNQKYGSSFERRISPSDMTLSAESGQARYRVEVQGITGYMDSAAFRINHISAIILIQ